ncbi:hypothetical protein EVA_17917, partial [gut metagenome]
FREQNLSEKILFRFQSFSFLYHGIDSEKKGMLPISEKPDLAPQE